jgi:hypothetical protein
MEYSEQSFKYVLKLLKIESAVKMFEVMKKHSFIKGQPVRIFYDVGESEDNDYYQSPKYKRGGRYSHQRDEPRREELQPRADIKIEDLATFLKPAHSTQAAPAKKEDPFGGLKPRDEKAFLKVKDEVKPQEVVPIQAPVQQVPIQVPVQEPAAPVTVAVPEKKVNEDEKWQEYEQPESNEGYYEQYPRSRGFSSRRGRKYRGGYYQSYRGTGYKQRQADEVYSYQNQEAEEHSSPKVKFVKKAAEEKKEPSPAKPEYLFL